MKRERLTPSRIAAFQCPPGKRQAFLWDAVMPRLAVRATAGARSFIFESKLDRRTIRITIGTVSAWPLDSVWTGKGTDRTEVQRGARQEAARLQSLVDTGTDPRELEQEQKAAKVAAKAEAQAAEAAKVAAAEQARKETEARQKYTLRALLDAYATHLEANGKRKSAQNARSMFRVHVLTDAKIADKPAREVTSEEVAAIVRRVTEAGKDRAAGVLRSCMSAAFTAAARAPFNPKLPSALIPFAIRANPVQVITPIAPGTRNRTLTPDELAAYIKAMGDTLPDQALKLALYAGGQRMAQLVRARVEDWDPDTKTLRLFDGKGKRPEPREHLLPLAPKGAALVAALVKRAKERGTADLFIQHSRPMDPGTAGRRLAEIEAGMGVDPFDLRDVRRTAETMLAGMGISRDVRAQLLSHGISGVQSQRYDRHGYTAEKHSALVAWEKRLEALRTGKQAPGNVTNIKRRAKA